MSDVIAFIGVGNMGNPMAENLLKAGKKIKVFDVSKEMLAKAKEKNLETTDNLDHCTLMITSNNKNTILKVRFDKIFPIALSSFTLDTTSEHNIVTATATFKFNSMTFDANI